MARRLHKLFFRTNLSKQDHIKTFYSNFLKIKRILYALGGKFRNRQLYNLFTRIRTKQRLIFLYKAFFFRCDFFLNQVGFAISGGQARQWIKHGHVLINGYPLTKNAETIKVKDLVSLSPKVYKSGTFKLARVRRHMLENFGFLPFKFRRSLGLLKNFYKNKKRYNRQLPPANLNYFRKCNISFNWHSFWSIIKLGKINATARLREYLLPFKVNKRFQKINRRLNKLNLSRELKTKFKYKLYSQYRRFLSRRTKLQTSKLFKSQSKLAPFLFSSVVSSNQNKKKLETNLSYYPTVALWEKIRSLYSPIEVLLLDVHNKMSKDSPLPNEPITIAMEPAIWRGNFVKLGRRYQVLMRAKNHYSKTAHQVLMTRRFLKRSWSSRRRLAARLRVWCKNQKLSFLQYHLRTCSVFVYTAPSNQTLPTLNNFDLNDLNQLRFIL